MKGMGRIAMVQAAAMAALLDPPRPPGAVVVVDIPPITPDEVFGFRGDSSGSFHTSRLPPRERPAFYKPNGAREQARRKRQREKRETKRLLSSTDGTTTRTVER